MPASGTNRTSGNPWKLPVDAESSFYSALTGDDFSPGTTEFQQPAMVKVRDLSKWPKKNAGTRPGACGFQECEPGERSSLTGSAELSFGVEDS